MTAPRWRDEAQRRGIVIAVTQDMEALPPVEGNAFELRDALVRLILNAVTAMPEGGALAIRAASEESGWVVVEVRDTGVGMSLEHAAPHRRARQEPATGPRGERRARRGRRHRGAPRRQRSAIESASGQGHRRAAAAAREPLPDHPRHRRARRAAASGRSTPRACSWWTTTRGSLTVLSDMLRAGGPCRHDRHQRRGGASRCSIPAAHDVVITDLGMPRTTGWEVAERIKTQLARDRASSSSPAGARACPRTSRASSSTA